MLAVVAGLVAKRLFETGAPPTPDMAIEEAKLTREVLEHPEVQQATGPIRREASHADPQPPGDPRSIERNRRELAGSVEDLRVKVKVLTDWRRQINEHRTAAIAGAAVLGFVSAAGCAPSAGAR